MTLLLRSLPTSGVAAQVGADVPETNAYLKRSKRLSHTYCNINSASTCNLVYTAFKKSTSGFCLPFMISESLESLIFFTRTSAVRIVGRPGQGRVSRPVPLLKHFRSL